MADEPKSPSDKAPPSSFDWRAFSQNTWLIVVAGIVLPPVGMILAWLKPGWSNRTRWIAIGLMGLVFIGRMQSRREGASSDGSASVSSETTTSTKSENPFQQGFNNGRRMGESEANVMKMNIEAGASGEINLPGLRRQLTEHASLFKDQWQTLKSNYERIPRDRTVENSSGVRRTLTKEEMKTRHESVEEARGVYEGYLSVVKPYLR